MKEVLELLKKGEVHNLGPTLDPSTPGADYPPVPALSTTNSGFNDISSNSPQIQTLEGAHELTTSTTSVTKPRVSRFKLTRNKNANNPRLESPATPTSTAERSSPKMPPTSISPQLGPTAFSTVVESPSFPPPRSPQPGESGRRLDRPPTILSAASLGSAANGAEQNDGRERRVSRFMAERT